MRGPAGEGSNAMLRNVVFTYPKSSNAAPCIWNFVLVHVCFSPSPHPSWAPKTYVGLRSSIERTSTHCSHSPLELPQPQPPERTTMQRILPQDPSLSWKSPFSKSSSWPAAKKPSQEGVLNQYPLGVDGCWQLCSSGCHPANARRMCHARRTSTSLSPAPQHALSHRVAA